MAVRSLNKVILIGNLTRDPELRYTPNGTAVCSFTVATNREWTVDSGEKREEAEFTKCVAWNKLAELCNQLLSKGRKVYVEGRLQTRSWTSADGQPRMATEVVVNDMIVLDSRRPLVEETMVEGDNISAPPSDQAQPTKSASDNQSKKKKQEQKQESKEEAPTEEVNPDDIPF